MFIRAKKSIINLKNITDLWYKGKDIKVYLNSGSEITLNFKNEEAAEREFNNLSEFLRKQNVLFDFIEDLLE